jgi:hypothetical protein
LFSSILICRKVRAYGDAFVWDRAVSQALSYKRCVSVLVATTIYKAFLQHSADRDIALYVA